MTDQKLTEEDEKILEEEEKILEEFHRNMLDNMVDTPPDFQKIINDNFWELLSDIKVDDK